MPILANYTVRSQTTGATFTNRQAGGPLLLGENVLLTASPAQGVPGPGTTTDFRAGACHPASVLGTGNNPDIIVWGPEAV
jgi:hypothetical protein